VAGLAEAGLAEAVAVRRRAGRGCSWRWRRRRPSGGGDDLQAADPGVDGGQHRAGDESGQRRFGADKFDLAALRGYGGSAWRC
jgi:hypothetical protein